MKKLQNLYSTFQGFGDKNGALYPMVETVDHMKGHYDARKKEIEDLVAVLEMRVQAEDEYAGRLFAIADRYPASNNIKISLISKELDSFKANCGQKARAAKELAENVGQDCLKPLKDLLKE